MFWESSNLVFYLRIFTPQTNPKLRLLIYALVALVILSTSVIFMLATFQCRPVAYFWEKNIKDGVP
jgi:hypothetical protein